MLRAETVTKKYGNFTALQDVSFEISKGSTVLLLGPNGAGKTTLINCIMGLLNFKGQIDIDGRDVNHYGKKVRTSIGYVPQHFSLYDSLSVRQQSEYMGRLKRVDNNEVKQRLKAANLWEQREKRVESLSSGMKQRLAIALSLFNDPPILIFDEPVSNVDVEGQLEFQSQLRNLTQLGKTMLIATHLSGFGELSEKAILLGKGRIVWTGAPKELLVKTGAKDTMFIKFSAVDAQRGLEIMKRNLNDGMSLEHEWVIAKASPDIKMNLLRALNEEGCKVEDLIIQTSNVESEYLKFQQRA